MYSKIEDFAAGGTYTGFFLIKWKDIRVGSNGKPYIDYTFADVTGTVNGKHWSPLSDIDTEYSVGEIVKLQADITEFNGALQAKVIKIRRLDPRDEVEIGDIVPSAPISSEDMMSEINSYIQGIGDDEIRALVEAMVDKVKEPLMYYPAAKANHHSIRGGLLYHMLRMLRSALALCKVYDANADLVCAGVVLHDLAKIGEMTSTEYGSVESYTVEGNLLGHIVMGIKDIAKTAEALGVSEEKSLLLQHLVLSHHYFPEFGSPKKPMIIEGEILHHVDILDATIYDMELALRTTEAGDFSAGVPTLDRRRIYKKELK